MALITKCTFLKNFPPKETPPRYVHPRGNKYSCGIAFSAIFQKFGNDPKFFEMRNILIFKILKEFETKVLNYTFKDKQILIQALNLESNPRDPLLSKDYQMLEFIGDALLEVLVIGNSFKLLEERNISLSPEVFQKVKVSLLSNSFMARISVLLGLHRYLINMNSDILNEINDYTRKIKFNFPYKNFVMYECNTPKVLSDLWESLSAAVLIDGGWKAAKEVFGKLLAPYLKFVCNYFEKIETNLINKLTYIGEEKLGKVVELKKTIKGDRISVMVYLGHEFVCEAIGKSSKLVRKKASMKACKKLKLI
jgi:dsRNA-specific ribonuclease